MFSTKATVKTQAFEGLAKHYDRARPSYPSEMFSAILTFWRKNVLKIAENIPVIIDVGCGTGISTRAIFNALDGHCQVIGIEPGRDMLATAREVSPPEITYQEGPAESLPLDTETVDVITAAQAAQWFDRPAFYRETKRVLKPGGVVAIYENNRDWEDSEFLNKHEEFLETHSVDEVSKKSYSRYYRDFPYEPELAEQFRGAHTQTFSWTRKMTPENFLTMAKSSTQVKRAERHIGEEQADALILENAKTHTGPDGQVEVKYNTRLYMARK